MKTQKEVLEMMDLTDECGDMSGMTYKDGVKTALEWVYGFGDAPFDEEDKEEQ